jgi:hypothetical protein
MMCCLPPLPLLRPAAQPGSWPPAAGAAWLVRPDSCGVCGGACEGSGARAMVIIKAPLATL